MRPPPGGPWKAWERVGVVTTYPAMRRQARVKVKRRLDAWERVARGLNSWDMRETPGVKYGCC